ncbi:MAG: YbbR-like domain-containing protein [Thermoanaerobaculia bacterium]
MTRSAGIWGLRLLAVVAAFTVWFSASFAKRERQSEKVIDATVTYNPARGVVILDPVQTVKVRLRGPDRLIRTLAPHVVDVVVAVETTDVGPIEIPIDESRVLRPEGVQVIAVDPNSLTLTLDYEREIEVPVTPRLVGEPAGGAVPLEPVARPARARISGPASLLTGLEGVTTSPISLDGHALTFQQTVSVVSPNPLVRIVAPAVVVVNVPMFVPALESGDLPIP